MNIHFVTPEPVATAESDRREAILDAALVLFAERTFEGTAVPLVAEAAGVAAGTIYRYFPSKEALVNALYQRWKGQLHDNLAAAIAAGGTPREQFGQLWRALWRFGATHPRAIAFLETHHHAPYLDEESVALGARIESETHAFVRAAQSSGAIRDTDPATVVALVMGAFGGLVKRAGPAGLREDDPLAATTEEMMWSALSA
jgi:AcrR family transcriptional regulator